jgi:hypothetical protein
MKEAVKKEKRYERVEIIRVIWRVSSAKNYIDLIGMVWGFSGDDL